MRVDESVPLPVAATVNCAVARALRLAGEVADQRVAVCGVGMLGVYACAMSKQAGARKVIAVDTQPSRLETARQFGADSTVMARPDRSGKSGALYASVAREVDVALEFSGAPQAVETALDWLAIGGRAIWVGATFPQRLLHVNAEQIVRRLLIIKGLDNYNQHDLLAALAFVETHHHIYPFASLVHDGFDLSEVNEAFAYALESSAYRVGVRIAQ